MGICQLTGCLGLSRIAADLGAETLSWPKTLSALPVSHDEHESVSEESFLVGRPGDGLTRWSDPRLFGLAWRVESARSAGSLRQRAAVREGASISGKWGVGADCAQRLVRPPRSSHDASR